ncbi:MAG: right-handed parallel beta-helix repeat-containing protein [Candidatus Micrarchaeota archaeon]|nr:right-handed parallel beta-helix repeat-containing protein [Candidatus Micrarchaeota archaeon]
MRLWTGTAWLAAIVFFLLAYPAAATTTVSECGVVFTPNETYELNQSLTGTVNGVECLIIYGDNSVLDCNGYSITGDGTFSTTGIAIDGINDTVKGCEVANYTIGIAVYAATETVENNKIHDVLDGIMDQNGNGLTAFNNTIYAIGRMGIFIADYDGMNISFNTISDIGNTGTWWSDQAAGIGIFRSTGSVISSNSISGGNRMGIQFIGSDSTVSNNTVFNCSLTNPDSKGIQLNGTYLNVSGNNASFNGAGFAFSDPGTSKSVFRNNVADNNTYLQYALISGPNSVSDDDIDTSNTANGEPIYYYYNESNIVLSGLSLTAPNTSTAKIICVHCTNFTVENSVFSNNLAGLYLLDVNNSLISNNSFSSNGAGALLNGAVNATLSGNTFTYNTRDATPIGPSIGVAIDMTYHSDNATIVNNAIATNASHGIIIDESSNANVTGNTVTGSIVTDFTSPGWSAYDIAIFNDANNSVVANNVVNGNGYGISTGGFNNIFTNNSVNNTVWGFELGGLNITLRNNTMDNSQFGFFLDALYSWDSSPADFDNDVDTSNTANGEPIYYLNRKTNYVIENLTLLAANTSTGKIIVTNGNNVTVRNIVIGNNRAQGIVFAHTDDSVVSNVTVIGCMFEAAFQLLSSHGNSFQNSTVADNALGILVESYSENNTVENCDITGNGEGVEIDANNTVLLNNNINGNAWGVYVGAYNAVLRGNNFAGNTEYSLYADTGYTFSFSTDSTGIKYASLSTAGDLSDSMWYTGTGVAAVNASANSDLNTSAEITMPFNGACPRVNLYYYANYTTDVNEIISKGQLCNSTSTPPCTIVSCAGNTVVFDVDHFDSYGGLGYDIPEFPGLAAAAALLLAAGGFALARKRK